MIKSIARSGLYFIESLPFSFFSRAIAYPDLPPPKPDQIRTLWKHILAVHQAEKEAVASGIYPKAALDSENLFAHATTFARVLADGVQVAFRMRNNRNKDFSKAAEVFSESAPDYYQRNFHFQTDGYFSEESAELYDHQVEILFSGTAGAMRRMILKPMQALQAIERPKILEIGCGAGSATRAVAITYPKAQVTALDISAPYLKIAQKKLHPYPHIDFVEGDGTDLNFKDATFDAVYSVYMFHELPKEERRKVLKEAWRVLKPGGQLIIADSLQWDDTEDLNWALERFPKAYHEPFYKNYIHDDLAAIFGELTEAKVETDLQFLTKAVSTYKPI